jgi:dolichol-phosphate mannosyltransferase
MVAKIASSGEWSAGSAIARSRSRAPRFAASNYPFFKMLRFAVDGIVSFSISPLKIVTWLGVSASIFAAAGMAYAFVLRLVTDTWVRGWTLLFMSMLLLGGIQMISLGILGEYVGRIYRESKRRPLYLVQETLGLDRAARSQPVPYVGDPCARV